MMNTKNPITLGTIAVAHRESGVCDVGERGVCYEVYTLEGRPGYGFIFESGRYDGFSPQEVACFLTVTTTVCHALADYRFTDVRQLDRDFRQGRFAPAFPAGNLTTA